jgi:hypothetical protein
LVPICTNYIAQFDIVANAKTPEYVEHIHNEAAKIPQVGERKAFLETHGLLEEGTPLSLLNTLILPLQV